jgi:hypothetical protein
MAVHFRKKKPSVTESHGERAQAFFIQMRGLHGDARNMTLLQAQIDVETIRAVETLTSATDRASIIAVVLNVVLVGIGLAGTVLGALALAK